ncbi:uncharacterized protein PHACADRAFT_265891 [Phanerochaete carnosa HHB-10118-sp]|uniref:MARVEL domain-containing protein n=1 Tax=Phanerochaete carnosa (strain HHB-10118-sp) TaxID=650164 RepID=K5UHP3_PHACS|nr:uncharacterized protein PHACADRAFT_265891 [Phanerochaete carnosa HHB-10118-sp]EKM49041.1 hypothetical protein PHACADRAFT_265891 [Phanerochaete carnosa HHB-10118-sp]
MFHRGTPLTRCRYEIMVHIKAQATDATPYVCLLWLFAAVTLGLSAARIHYTLHIPPGDPLNRGVDFYDPIVAELLATSAITVLWVPWVVSIITRTYDYGIVSTFLSETIGLFILFVLWLVGAAIATSSWGNLAWCHIYLPCRVLTALVAFAWMSFIMVFVLLIISVMFSIANRAFKQPMHGRYDPRSSYAPSYRV